MTALSALAASLSPGQWGSLSPANQLAYMANGGGLSSYQCAYAMRSPWDPTLRRIHFLGADHYPGLGDSGAIFRHWYYDDDTNALVNLAEPSWFNYNVPDGGDDVHGYCLTTINPSGRKLYRMPYGRVLIHVMNLDTGSWSLLPSYPGQSAAVIFAIAFFPERNSLIVSGNTDQWEFSETSQTWTQIGSTSGLISTWQWAEYDPIHKAVFLSTRLGKLWKYTEAGSFTQLQDTGKTLFSDGSGDTMGSWTCDPVSGTHLLWGAWNGSGRNFDNYDAVGDSFSANTSTPPTFIQSCCILGGACSTYGVVLYLWCENHGASAGAAVYKHAASSLPKIALVQKP